MKRAKNKGLIVRLLSVATIIGLFPPLFINCAPKKSSGPPPPWLAADAPKSDGQYFYGTGCAQYQIHNRQFKKRTARERARVDLAENIHEHLITELAGDTTAVRKIVEASLPQREIDETYMDEEGNFCARERLSRKVVDELQGEVN